MHLLCQGNALRLPLADQSVHCVVTSPPYWGLRDYGTAVWQGGEPECDHLAPPAGGWQCKVAAGKSDPYDRGGNKGQQYSCLCAKCGARRIDSQLGLEPTPDEYIAKMVQVFREVWRVLRDDGTCWVNMGDCYNSSPSNQLKTSDWGDGKVDRGNGQQRQHRDIIGLKPKDLVGIPWRLAFALQADGWYLRSDIIWAKPNPMPESVTDRPTKSHEYLFLLSKSERYYFDADAVRDGAVYGRRNWGDQQFKCGDITRHHGGGYAGNYKDASPADGRNIRSVWTIPTEAYPGSHFATFPRKLVEPCIKAGTSEKGCCPLCGKPWERVVESASIATRPGKNIKPGTDEIRGVNYKYRFVPVKTDRGWNPGCHCRDPIDDCLLPPVSCVVFDPFIGSGTTIVVANALGRQGIGLDLSADYLKLARQRITRPHAAIQRPGREESHPLFDRDA